MWLVDKFGVSMLPETSTVRFSHISEEEVSRLLSGGFFSAVGSPNAADFIARRLGLTVPVGVWIKLRVGDKVIIAQGARPPEGRVLTEEEVFETPIRWILAEVITA